MSTDFGRFLTELVQALWPFERVNQWQKGVMSFAGKYWRTVGPGLYLRILFLMDLVQVDMVAESHVLPDSPSLETQDGGTVGFKGTIDVVVLDAAVATNSVTDYERKAVNDSLAIACETIATVKPSRLEPRARQRLIATILANINAVTNEYGVEVATFRFTTFLRNIPNVRLHQSA